MTLIGRPALPHRLFDVGLNLNDVNAAVCDGDRLFCGQPLDKGRAEEAAVLRDLPLTAERVWAALQEQQDARS